MAHVKFIMKELDQDNLDSGSEADWDEMDIYGLSSTASYESAIIGEAHGLITDMLADSSLPPHVVSGLRSVSNLLKPQDSHGQMHKPKVSPLVSLTESGQYGSDNEDLPYTGERPSSLPKRFRRSLPPSLMRRMSTSTWTTTTSATGLPTLEPEVCRTRSSSFRHSRENTPGSSPTNSRSNSPSPSSPTTISLMIPKSRSFSATVGPVPASKRNSRERRSGTQNPPDSNMLSPIKPEKVKGLPRSSESDSKDITVTTPTGKETYPSLSKRLNITSDYESSDSPGSSDHSDNVGCSEESPATGSKCQGVKSTSPLRPKKLVDNEDGKPQLVKTSDSLLISSSSSTTTPSQLGDKSDQVASLPRVAVPSSKPAPQGTHLDNLTQITAELESRAAEAAVETDESGEIILPYSLEEIESREQLHISRLSEWDYSIFDLAADAQDRILSQVAYKIFTEVGLFETFRIPLPQFLSYFHSLELGYREKPYHNRVHATDVLHGVYYLSTQPIPGFPQVNPEGDMFQKHISSSESDSEASETKCPPHCSFTAEDTYGIMGGNLPPLELMALYTAAAMHDYDHPGRTNAFLVTTNSPLAILYNDRSVLESHHAASAWRLFLSNPHYNWLCGLDKAEFKRFRFLVIEAVLATDLKRHFELLAEFNAKVNDEDAPGIDWTNEADRLMVSNMVIKLADINGPCKRKDLHVSWTDRITEEFYEQGDEESRLGLQISPYMDRRHPQLAKLQESFINHLVAPLCNAVGGAGLIPGTWVEDDSESEDFTDSDKGEVSKDTEEEEDTEVEAGTAPAKKKRAKKIHCWLTKNLKDNHDMWVAVLKQEAAQKERESKKEEQLESIKGEMEPISEEDTPPNSANNLSDDQANPSPPPGASGTNQDAAGLTPASSSQPLANNTSTVQQTSQTEFPSPCLPRRSPSPLTTPTCTIIQAEPTCSPSSQSEPQGESANQNDESRIQLTPERCILNKDLSPNRSTEV